MATERTLSIIKPNATKKHVVGKIIDRFESEGLTVRELQMCFLDRSRAEGFYAEHREKPFFNDLVSFMTSGEVVLMVLEGENAIEKNRKIMGATNPAKADSGTLRKLFGDSLEANAVHGSDSPTSAKREIDYFFPKYRYEETKKKTA